MSCQFGVVCKASGKQSGMHYPKPQCSYPKPFKLLIGLKTNPEAKKIAQKPYIV